MLQIVRRSAIVHMLYTFTSEFKSHVTSAVYTDLTDQIEDYVLTGDPFVRFADKLNLNCFRYFEPSLPSAIATPASVEPTPVENAFTAP